MDLVFAHKSILYFALVSLFGVAIIVWIFVLLRRSESRVRGLLRKRRTFEAVSTDSPLADPNKAARAVAKESIDYRYNSIRKLLPALVLTVILPFALLPFLSKAPAIYVSLFVGAASVIIGTAAKPFIENVIGGLVITLGQPIRIGDTLEIDGNYGTVEKITLTYTVIKIWDWRRYIIPNNKITQKEYVNLSLYDSFQWAHIEFWVAPDADIEVVEKVAIEAAKNSAAFAPHEDPSFWVLGNDKDSVRCWVAGWADSPAKAWDLKHQIRSSLMRGLTAHNIECQKNIVHMTPPGFASGAS